MMPIRDVDLVDGINYDDYLIALEEFGYLVCAFVWLKFVHIPHANISSCLSPPELQVNLLDDLKGVFVLDSELSQQTSHHVLRVASAAVTLGVAAVIIQNWCLHIVTMQ